MNVRTTSFICSLNIQQHVKGKDEVYQDIVGFFDILESNHMEKGARELQQMLREIISTIRTIPSDTSLLTLASYFNSREGVLNNLRLTNNQLRL